MSEVINIKELNERIERESVFVDTLRSEMGKVIIGQNHLIDTLLIGLLSNGHILLEGVPGLAKTLAITTLAKAVDADFSRIQFTPDLLPADLIGTLIYSQKSEDFIVKKGPIFANFVLADEISPDTCRLWDSKTNEKLDKDRFRRDLGKVREAYEEILARLEKVIK